jgi:hypothetical protein
MIGRNKETRFISDVINAVASIAVADEIIIAVNTFCVHLQTTTAPAPTLTPKSIVSPATSSFTSLPISIRSSAPLNPNDNASKGSILAHAAKSDSTTAGPRLSSLAALT